MASFVRGLYDGDGTEQDNYIAISGNIQRFKKLQQIVPVECSVREAKNKDTENHGTIYFTGESSVELIEWMYPEREKTKPKLNRKFPEWY